MRRSGRVHKCRQTEQTTIRDTGENMETRKEYGCYQCGITFITEADGATVNCPGCWQQMEQKG